MDGRPTYGTGFARNAWESAHPELWRGIIGLWSPFLGPTGGRLIDWSGNRNDGLVAAGSPTWIRQGLSFDGTTDRINTADTAFMDGIGQFSISTRVRKNVQPLGALGNIVAKDGAGNAGFYLQIQPGNRVVFFVNTTVSSATFSNADTEISDTLWHDIVAIYTGVNLNVWLDGVLSSEQNALTGALFSSAHPLSFGAEDRAQILFDGRIDYVTIWDRVLIPNEIAQLCANPWHLHEPIRIPISVVAAPVAFAGPLVNAPRLRSTVGGGLV